jgi:rod shape-determining protein MreD
MKPRVYLGILLLIIPFQASLLNPLSLAGIKPDFALVVVFIIGLLTGPAEAAMAGMGVGLVQDIGSASLLGFSGFTRGLVGLAAGLLGAKVLDIGSPTIVLFLAAVSLAEGILISLFLQVTYGAVPFFSMISGRLLPQAVSTAVLGLVVLQLINRKDVLAMLIRRNLQKEL